MRYCGRDFTPTEIELIRELLTSPQMNRARLSREVCERLGWRRDNGGLKDMSCRVALNRMHADGLITLPPPRNPKPVTYRSYPHIEQAVLPPGTAPSIDLRSLQVDPVLTKAESLLWNAYIERHHYLGHQPMPGAQLRYFVRAAGHIVAALGFGASAWKVKPRDQVIGWSREQRQRNLHLVVNNARFLILPWIQSKGLASKILSRVARQLPHDWNERYGYRPVLLETFVESERHRGTCYKAANWVHVGQTTGRGKKSRVHHQIIPIKDIWLYPLRKNFRAVLCN